ncbi:MAG: hypothetical protein AAFN63_03770 [Pseudomonadota bacterium]
MTHNLTQLHKLKAIKAMRTRRARIEAVATMATAKQFAQAEEQMRNRARAAQQESMTYLREKIATLDPTKAFDQGLAYLGQNAIWLERRAQNLITREASLREKERKARGLAEDAVKRLAQLKTREEIFSNFFNGLRSKHTKNCDLQEEEDTLDLFKQKVTDGQV